MCLMAVHLTERPPRRKERCLSAGRPDAGERCDDLPLPAPSRQISHANGRAPSARAGHGQLLERVLPWLSGSSSCHGAHVGRLLTSILQDVFLCHTDTTAKPTLLILFICMISLPLTTQGRCQLEKEN
jgi:hypothetical protein